MLNVLLKFIALIGILFLAPLILAAIIFVFLEDGSPVLFIQKRIGKLDPFPSCWQANKKGLVLLLPNGW